MSKHKRPDEAVFDDEKDRAIEEMYDPDAPDIRTGMDSGAASANEMTGLVPGGSDMSPEEYEENKNLFPFGTPNILPR